MKATLLLGGLASTFLFGACGGGDDARSAYIVYGSAAGIVEQPSSGGEERVLVPAPSPTNSLTDPAISPDGKLMVYSHAPPLERTDGYLDAHSDLWVAERDGSNTRRFYEHSRPTEVVSAPLWLDDNTVFAVIRHLRNPSMTGSGSVWALARIDVETGERSDVLEDVLAFAFSPERDRLAYVAIDSVEEQPIYVASSEGSTPTLLIDSSSGLDGFSGLAFSEDGATLFFGAHEEDAAARRLVSRLFVNAGRPSNDRTSSLLHDAPVDLWSIAVQGGDAQAVADLEVTSPHFALADDGVTLFALAQDLLRIAVDSGIVETIGQPNAFGSLDTDG